MDFSELEATFIGKGIMLRIFFDQEVTLGETYDGDGPVKLWVEEIDENKDAIPSFSNVIDMYPDDQDSTCLVIYISSTYDWFKSQQLPYGAKVSITIEQNSVAFINTDIIFPGVSKGDERFTVETKWGLTPTVDFLSFTNVKYSSSNPYGGFADTYWAISQPMAKILLSIADTDDACIKIEQRISSDAWKDSESWNGSCTGMASIVALAKMKKLNLQVWDPDAATCYQLAKPMDSTEPFGTRDLINYYQ